MPACDLDATVLPCTYVFEEGAHMLGVILAQLSQAAAEGCGTIEGFIAHQEPVTTESDYLAAWYVGESVVGVAGVLTETEVSWRFKLVESGFALPFNQAAGGVASAPLDVVHSQSRYLYSRLGVLRSVIAAAADNGTLLPSSCTRARLVRIAPAAGGELALAGHAGWVIDISYVRVG